MSNFILDVASSCDPQSKDLNIQINQLLKSNTVVEEWAWERGAEGCQQMVKIKLAGYYTFPHFKV